MGLIKAAAGAVGGTLADQWKEFFYCDSMESHVLAVKGQKRTGGRSSNTKGEDNIISSGSGIAVADGQCMLIVEQGKVVEVCAEPGEFTYDASTEPSIFSGNLGAALDAVFDTVGRRFTYGGDTGKDQRVYYINTKELVGNKFGTPNPVPFRVVDKNVGLDVDVSIRCNGVYSYKIVNPLLFYVNVCGNVEREYTRDELDAQLKAEFISALQPAFSRISELEIRPNAIPGHVTELTQAMNAALTQKWKELRGLAVVSVAINSLTLPEDDVKMIQKIQKAAVLRDPTLAAATLTEAQAAALEKAAENSAGAMTGFVGMDMASRAGGVDAKALYEMGAKQNGGHAGQQGPGAQTATNAGGGASADAGGWTCSCGAHNKAEWKFCNECGKPRPEAGWRCSCGTWNTGKFCTECGSPRPASEAAYRCSRCGWTPEDVHHPPKFCPVCGDPFNEGDKITS